MRKKLFPLAAFALMMASCANEELINSPEELTDPVIFSGVLTSTRTSISELDGSTGSYPVLWSTGDALGVISNTAGTIATNAKATLTERSEDFKSGTFSSLNVKMNATGTSEFYLYYPYNKDAMSNTVSNSGLLSYKTDGTNPYVQGMLSSTQIQPEADDCSHFGEYGYAVAKSSAARKGEEVQFSMKHILSYLELNVKTSGSLSDYSVQEVYVVAPTGEKLTGPFKGLFDGTYAEVAGTGATAYSNTLSLNIANTGKQLTTTHQKFLMTLLPVDLAGKDLQIVVQVAKGAGNALQTRFYTVVLEGRKFESGTLSVVNGSLDDWKQIFPMKTAVIWNEGTDEVITDVALTSGASSTDLGAGGTKLANSYMVNGAGTYSFPAKMPNGEPCLGIEGDLNYISFTIPPGATPFNASIGLYFENPDDATHASNRILWSWHIWNTPTVATTTVGGVTFMDRDLGATGTTGVDAMGYYFQWGRKDPFPRVSSLTGGNEDPATDISYPFNHNTIACKMNTAVFGANLKWDVARESNYSGYIGGYQDLAKYPTKFVDGVSIGPAANGLILTDGHKNMPSYGQDVWKNTAGTNNPCPYGYHVPTKAEIQTLLTAGRTWTSSGSNGAGANITGASPAMFIAAAGYRNNEYGDVKSFQSQALFWTDAIRATTIPYKYGESLEGTSSLWRFYQGRISGGRSVRCAQDTESVARR